jgi:hypothetical protein
MRNESDGQYPSHRGLSPGVVATVGERFGINVLTPAKATRPETPAADAKTTDTATVWGAAARNSACDMIVNAESGSQEETLNGQCFGIGQLVVGGELPESEALSALHATAAKIPDPARLPKGRAVVCGVRGKPASGVGSRAS